MRDDVKVKQFDILPKLIEHLLIYQINGYECFLRIDLINLLFYFVKFIFSDNFSILL